MKFGEFLTYTKERGTHMPGRDMVFTACMGFVVALLLLPLLFNLGVGTLLVHYQISTPLSVILFLLIAPIGMMAGAFFLILLPFREQSAAQLSRYAVIGAFNVALNAAIFNTLILLTGISRGAWVTGFAVITFFIVVTQAFFWSVFWTFRNAPPQNRIEQYKLFLAVSSSVACVNIAIIHVLVNVVGAPAGVPGPVWANIALLCTVFTALLGNFLGYKYLVFRH